MASDDLKSKALDSSHDFYDLLNTSSTASASEIRTAYRKTSRLYHPDKVGPNNVEAREKFELVQIAADVLSDPAVRELYDNARRARHEKKEREAAFDGRRKWMKEDLERREGGALKRKRDERAAEDEFERELGRIAEDTRRRRREREGELRREAESMDVKEEKTEEVREGQTPAQQSNNPSEMDRSVTFRYPSPSELDKDAVSRLWGRFGPVEVCVLREKKIKKDGEKHRQLYTIAMLVYKSIVGAHAAVSDFSKVQAADESHDWKQFEAVGWAAGQEPDCIPKTFNSSDPTAQTGTPLSTARAEAIGLGSQGSTAKAATSNDQGAGSKRAPSFASFKSTTAGTPKGGDSYSLDDITMIRLKNAQRRRMEEAIRKEEAGGTTNE
ncbi:hypothetical protein LTR78_000466 [Recurvomyces mirabilis]|uniref:J domain-containing protein n=1 Tax=Recurvomyces mirabilis TaxID=574656 RepID=A0AAE1C6K4_9PEZI|nr:hypothetical protein LTR78_000466 [Recurvomyces mirabilis]KAK5162121.1 hypothetical protein LTS14_000467 [Recurvomyces mirabilis]